MKKYSHFTFIAIAMLVLICGFLSSSVRLYPGGCLGENVGTVSISSGILVKFYATNCSFIGENPELSVYFYEKGGFFGEKIVSYYPSEEGVFPDIYVGKNYIDINIHNGETKFSADKVNNYKIHVLGESKFRL